jgi:transposase
MTMSRQEKSHIRGKRGQAFADKIRGINQEQILCVSLDISKYFHVVMIHNKLGEIVTPTFEIGIFKTGFERLCQALDEAIERTQAQLVLLGMEPTGHYFENLARHLLQRSQPVVLINSYAVSQNRKQQMMRREKSDPIDVAAIGDLLGRGEGSPFQPLQGIYLELQQLDRVRQGKVKMRTMLKNQIIGHLDRIFPGLVIIGEAAKERYSPVFVTDFWECQTMQHLIRVCPDPRQLAAMSTPDLIAAFHAHNFKMGPKTAAKIIRYAQKVLLPDPEVIAIRSELLYHDLILLDAVEERIAVMEDRLIDLVSQTPYQVWTKLKGLSDIQVARLAASIGDPDHYSHAKQIFRRSGLVSGRNDSGVRQKQGKGNKVVKTGDVHLRRALLDVIHTFVLHQPVLFSYYAKLKLSKPDLVARVATARRANGILWATLRDQHSTTLVYKRGVQM